VTGPKWTPAGVRFASRRGRESLGLRGGCGVGSWGRAAAGGASCWLARHCSLFDPPEARSNLAGRSSSRRPRAHHGAQRQSLDVFDGSLMGASEAEHTARGVDGASTVIAWMARDK
jgi:hypothetical protein